MTRPAVRLWRTPLVALALAVVAGIIVLALGLATRGGFSAGLITTFPLGMAAAAIVASGQARQFGIPVPFVVALAAVIAFGFAMLDLALASALAQTIAGPTSAPAQAAANNQRTGFILLGLVIFAVSATVLSALASRRGAASNQIVGTQLLLALACLPLLNVIGAAIWFWNRFNGRGLPVAPDEFLPPREKPTR